MSIRNKGLREDIMNLGLEKKQKEQDEQKIVYERNKWISQLNQILSVLSKEELRVKTSIDNMRREMNTNFNEFLTNRIANCLSNGSDVGDSSFQVPDSFFGSLSDVKPKLDQLSKQKLFVEQLIQNVSPSVSTALSEFEQRIISILKVKSFFESQTVTSVQRMINVCLSMRECLNILGIYSEEIKKLAQNPADFNIDSQILLSEEIKKLAQNPADFDIDSQILLSNTNSLNQVSQELADFKQKIDEIFKSFSEKYYVESLFSESANFSPFFEFMRSFDDEIQRVTANFSTTKSILVRFVNDEFYFRKDFVNTVCRKAFEEQYGRTDETCFHDKFNKYYIEPAGATRQRFEAMLRSLI